MKTCTVIGDLSSERSGENYPTVVVCDECLANDRKRKEDRVVISESEYDPSFGNSCEFCDKTYAEEELEQ